MTVVVASSVAGSLLGTAFGDALGLPYEGMSPSRAARLLGLPDRFRLLPGRGMISDDTEHACITAQAFVETAGQPAAFSRALARRLRHWLWMLPAGVGFATLRALLKSSAGVPPDRSGVMSAGNGPAMRASVLGAASRDLAEIRELVHRSTVITHRDPRAVNGALVVAVAAHHAKKSASLDRAAFLDDLRSLAIADDLMVLVEKALDPTTSLRGFAAELGLERGVTGFINHTVPIAIRAWVLHPDDMVTAVRETIECGGDTDSVAAIVGGIIGASSGGSTVPLQQLERIAEWPRTMEWIASLGDQTERVMRTRSAERPLQVPLAGVLARNAFFLTVVLLHGFRRAFPPY